MDCSMLLMEGLITSVNKSVCIHQDGLDKPNVPVGVFLIILSLKFLEENSSTEGRAVPLTLTIQHDISVPLYQLVIDLTPFDFFSYYFLLLLN